MLTPLGDMVAQGGFDVGLFNVGAATRLCVRPGANRQVGPYATMHRARQSSLGRVMYNVMYIGAGGA